MIQNACHTGSKVYTYRKVQLLVRYISEHVEVTLLSWTDLTLSFEQGEDDAFLTDGQEITHDMTSRNQS